MPSFDIVKKTIVDPSFKTSKVMADFDVGEEHVSERFKGEIIFPDKWQIGLIVGSSGTGKTTIMNEIFKEELVDDFVYSNRPVIEDVTINSVEETERMFYSVGFGSVPSWLKPYSVLSNGEKMRVDLARKLLSSDFVVFDEFTSVVDRQVAKVICIALKKAIKKYPSKKFVAVGCHHDVLEFLQPDWCFNTNDMKQSFTNPHDLKKSFISKNAELKSGGNLGVIII